MSRIYVQFAGLRQIGNRCTPASSAIADVKDSFQRTINQLDWDIKFQSDINSSAGQITRRLEKYTEVLKSYKQFIEDACDKYIELDEYKKTIIEAYIDPRANQVVGPNGQFKYDWKDFVSSFGNVGKIFGIFDKLFNATTWNEWAAVGLSIGQTISKIAKDYNNYTKIGRAIGTNNATAYFWRKQFGFRSVGHASTASSPTARFYNNLHNTTSAYNLRDAFAPLAGKKGVGTTVAAWAGVALTGISNAFSNIDEQKESNGTMSTGRVIAETISETAIDTAVTYAGTAVVGAAITAATGVVAAPVAVAVVTGVALAGINAGVEALTGKSATEWVSDAVLDTAVAIGDAVSNGAKAVASWFGKLSFA